HILSLVILFFLFLLPPPVSTLFPYTTLFRSHDGVHLPQGRRHVALPLLVAPHEVAVARARLVAQDDDDLFGGIESLVVIVGGFRDRKSTRLNSSHGSISYAVFCLKKKN